jgi:tyrosyl-tRNA synthetase
MPMTIDEQMEILTRGAVEVLPREALIHKLQEAQKNGKPLQIKLGLDPTAPDIHLGNAVVLRKLRKFQDLGHEVTVIIGDFTTLIGDPTGRSETRPQLTREQVAVNAKTYADQYHKILDPAKTSVRFNGEWLGKLNLYDVIGLMAKTTIARLLERDEFSNRFKGGIPIHCHELLYPICQAYDSVVLKSDVEMGGTDQKFNIMMGRDLQREHGVEHPQIGLFMPLLVGLDGVDKMSKSKGNAVGIDEPPLSMFEKLMSISDEMMPSYFELCTDLPMAEVNELCNSEATHPMTAKKRLGTEIVTIYHGAPAALQAAQEWQHRHSERQVPTDIPEFNVIGELYADQSIHSVRLAHLLVAAGFVSTNGEAKRLIAQGGVQIDGHKIGMSESGCITVSNGQVLSSGRRRFVRLKLG